jgi:hypothetical protein
MYANGHVGKSMLAQAVDTNMHAHIGMYIGMCAHANKLSHKMHAPEYIYTLTSTHIRRRRWWQVAQR